MPHDTYPDPTPHRSIYPLDFCDVPLHLRGHIDLDGSGDAVANPDTIKKNEGRIVAFTPLSGILNQDKYLPIRYAPIQIELEVVSNAADAVNTSGSNSTNWNISDVQLKCDVISLDNHLDNDYAQHLLSGKALPINFSSYTTISQAVSGPDVTLNISRAVTRLKAVFVTMFSTATASEKEANLFYHSMGATAHDPDAEVEIQMQIGSKKFPEYPIKSAAEAFYHLRKTVGIHASPWASTSLIGRWYRHDKFIVGVDTEKVLGASFTGYNSKAGDLLTVSLKKTGAPTKVFTTLHYDSILNVMDSGVQVLE